MRSASWWLVAWAVSCCAQEFSGPQPGEVLAPFKVLAATGPHAGREMDYITEFGDAPILLVFIRDIDRNVYRTLWPCDRYAAERPDLKTLYVYLAADRVEGERRMQAVAKSLSLEAPTATSLEGVEGPGAYGLNKRVAVTAIIARGRKVVFNRAIVQPGASEAQTIIAECVKLVGGMVPSDLWLARGPARRGKVTQAVLEETLAADPPQLADAFARLTPPQLGGPGLRRTIEDVKAWAGSDAGRRRYVAGRIPAVSAICESEEARSLLDALKEELSR